LNEAYELFGCGTGELYVIAVSGFGYDDDEDLINYWNQHGLIFRGISQDGGSGAIESAYQIGYFPTYILIAPDRTIVEQDMWPISSTQTFVNYFQNNGLTQSTCYPLAANFEADQLEFCEGEIVNFTDLSEGVPITWEWTFEGGDITSSTEQNPEVLYMDAGEYDVTLTVHDGVFTETLLMEDYIIVHPFPNVSLDPFEVVCVDWPEYELSGGMPEGGVYGGDYVSDGMFHPAEAGLGDHIITYAYTNAAGCESIAEQTITVEACTGIAELTEDGIQIFPNPARDVLNLTSETEILNIRVYNNIGQSVIEKTIKADSYQLNTSDLESGIYFIRLELENNIVMKRLVIQ